MRKLLVVLSVILCLPSAIRAQVPTLWGNIISSGAWSGGNEYGVYSFPATEEGFAFTEVKKKISMNVNAGGVYFNQRHYYMSYTNVGFFMGSWVADDITDDWRNVDGGEFYDNTMAASDLTYDSKNKVVYGVFNSGKEIASLDFSTMKRTKLTTIYNYPVVAIAADKEGVLYWIDSQGYLAYWNTTYGFGFTQTIGKVGVTPDENKLQSAIFDTETGKLYWSASLSDGTSGLYEVDTKTALATKVVSFPNNEQVVSLYIPKPEAADGAPAAVKDLSVQFEGPSTEGTVTYTMPSKTYKGDELTGTLNYVIKVNGTDTKTGQATAGTKVTEKVTVAEGDNTISVVVTNTEGDSPEASVKQWAGYDEPKAPTGVTLSVEGKVASITWTAPTAGMNGGYLDTENMTYKVVRMPGSVEVATGLKTTSITDNLPDGPMTSYSYKVVAVNGTRESLSGISNSVVAGSAFEVPYSEDFEERANFQLFSVLDVASDYSTWNWNYNGEARCQNSYYNGNNDYLITPPIKFESGQMYNISYRMKAGDSYIPQVIAVTMGEGDDATTFATTLQATTEVSSTSYTTYESTFSVEKTGEYRLAFHCTTEEYYSYIALDDITITKGSTFAAPDRVTNLKAEAGAKGAQSATIRFTAPAKTIAGDKLTALSKIEVSRGGTIITTIETPEPGKAMSVEDDSPAKGINSYEVVAYSATAEAGLKATTTVYVGTDKPLPPRDIRMIDNGDGSATITWADVPEEGANGGYVDATKVTYNVYMSDNTLLKGDLTEKTYTVTGIEQTTEPSSLIYRLSATNEEGESATSRTNIMLLGPASPIPFAESFAQGRAQNDWFIESPNSMYSFQPTTLKSSDDDLGSTAWQAGTPGEDAWLNSGKISAENAKRVVCTFDYYVTPGKDVALELYLNKAGKEEERLDSVNFKDDNEAEGWRHGSCQMSGAESASYFYIRFHGMSNDVNTPVIIDNIKIFDQPSKDLSITLQAPTQVRAGTELPLTVAVVNNGAETATGYTIRIKNGDKDLVTMKPEAITTMGRYETTARYKVLASDAGIMNIKAELEYADEDQTNNVTEEVAVTVNCLQSPTVGDLAGTQADGKVKLTWSAPQLDSTETTDSFEEYSAWSIDNVGDWTLVDGDGFTTFGIYGVEYKHKMEPMSFIVFNPSSIGIDVEEDAEMRPHTGNQFMACFDADPEEPKNEGDVKNDDWLISPELSGDAQTVSFWARNFSAYDVESFEILYSTTGKAPADFTKLVSKQGEENWTKYTAELPAGAKYFAIHVVSRNKFAFFVDDVTYTPAKQTIGGYNIYRDGELIGNTTSLEYEDEPTEGSHRYVVTVVYANGESQFSNTVTLEYTGIDKVITEGQQWPADVYDLQGVCVARGATSLQGLEPGVYIVNGVKCVKR